MTVSIVIAPDSFKGSLAARDAADSIASGWRSVRPHDALVVLPLADGGEGSIDAIERAVPGSIRRSAGMVTGPDGRPVPGEWLELPGGIAVVELAQCSGLPLMSTPDPLGATTRGLGEVVGSAVAAGATALLVALGGSASTDGGAGALAALGLRMADATGTPIPDGGGALAAVATIELGDLLAPPPGGVTLLTDVTAPLLGDGGAAAVFGPQKGATASDIHDLDAALTHFARLLGRLFGGNPAAQGAGAAGGTAYGFAAAWGAHIVSGAEYIARLVGLESAVTAADLVITGEGRFDAQSLGGKATGHVLLLADGLGTPTMIIAGQLGQVPPWPGTHPPALSLAELAGGVDAALADPHRWLRAAGAAAARGFRPAR